MNSLSKQVILFRNFLHEKYIDRKNKVHDDKEHEKRRRWQSSFFHRPPESGLILHRSCVIYDGGRSPVSQGGENWEDLMGSYGGGGRSHD